LTVSILKILFGTPIQFIGQWHGVNLAEGLKALPSTYRFTHNQSGAFNLLLFTPIS
jgi:hypothetical protein